MVFTWLTEHRRRSILAEPFPPAWIEILSRDMPGYVCLAPDEQSRLHDLLRIFSSEKNWEGCGGLTLTDEIKVVIAGQACLLILNLDREVYPNVETILVYPSAFLVKMPSMGQDGAVDESPRGLLGEAWSIGPVIVSWADAHEGGLNPTDGRNVVYHEFAHKLDLRDGRADGVPRLEDDAQYETWAKVMSAEYSDLVKKAERHRKTLLDFYGAVSPAEFFAVATECFFEKSARMRETHPDLYEVLRGFYRQDTAERAKKCI